MGGMPQAFPLSFHKGAGTLKNAILLRRMLRLIVSPGAGALPEPYLATAMKNLESLGFTFSPALMDRLRTLPPAEFAAFYRQAERLLRQMVGAHVPYRPMYPNFPRQVMEASAVELYVNAIIHYVTLRRPHTAETERPPLLDRLDLKVIDLGTGEQFDQLMHALISARSSLSATDQADLEWALSHHENLEAILPDQIPSKEKAAFVSAVLLQSGRAPAQTIAPYIQTPTDALRLAVALSGGDLSLAAATRFRTFKRSERRMLLELLERCGNPAEEMRRYKEPWKRLGEILHPAEYRHRFPRAGAAFDLLRNDRPVVTWNGRVEAALLQGDLQAAADLLAQRPGYLARRLDHLLRLAGQTETVLGRFSTVIDQVSTPVLLQVMAHFMHREEAGSLRTFFPKGEVAKVFAIPNRLPPLDSRVRQAVVDRCEGALKQRFARLPALGKVYVDERLRKYTLPFAQRSASKSLRSIPRGSRLPMPEGSTIRFFTWWKEGLVQGRPTGRVDIDLSAVIYDSDWTYKTHISYTQLRAEQYNAFHSGDLIAAPEGACEFIDLDIASVRKRNGRYVVFSLQTYTDQPYCNLPECYAGWMMREDPNSGEVFEPATVQEKLDITADTRICIPVILDLKEREVLWTDLALRRHPKYVNSVEGNQKGMVLMGRALTTLVKPSLYDLFRLHGLSRGALVSEPDRADTLFAVDQGITPFAMERVLAEFMA